MPSDKELKEIAQNLKNRQFDLPTIKEHLHSLGYNTQDIETIISEIEIKANSQLKNTITPTKGIKGVLYVVLGLFILFSLLLNGRDAVYPILNLVRLFAGLFFLIAGLYIITRPLK